MLYELIIGFSPFTGQNNEETLKNIKNLAAEKVNTLNGATAPQMLAYTSSSSYPTLSDLQAWTNYHKESGRLDNILNKCYECIRDRNKGELEQHLIKLKKKEKLTHHTLIIKKKTTTIDVHIE